MRIQLDQVHLLLIFLRRLQRIMVTIPLKSLSHTMLGMETNKISYFNKDVNDLNNLKPIELILTRTEVQPGNKNSFLENKYKPDILFPAVFQSISP